MSTNDLQARIDGMIKVSAVKFPNSNSDRYLYVWNRLRDFYVHGHITIKQMQDMDEYIQNVLQVTVDDEYGFIRNR
jgi:hypothetical protein